jgi:hypothetical protein
LADEGTTGRRDTLLALLIALSVAAAMVLDTGLECRVHETLARAASRPEPRAGPADPAVAGTEAEARTGLTSLTNP